MADVTIDRLTLQLPHGDEGEARRLTQLLTGILAGALRDAPGGDIPRLTLSLRAMPGESAEALSGRIAAALTGGLTGGEGGNDAR